MAIQHEQSINAKRLPCTPFSIGNRAKEYLYYIDAKYAYPALAIAQRRPWETCMHIFHWWSGTHGHFQCQWALEQQREKNIQQKNNHKQWNKKRILYMHAKDSPSPHSTLGRVININHRKQKEEEQKLKKGKQSDWKRCTYIYTRESRVSMSSQQQQNIAIGSRSHIVEAKGIQYHRNQFMCLECHRFFSNKFGNIPSKNPIVVKSHEFIMHLMWVATT